MGLPIVSVTERAAAETIVSFVKGKFVFAFGAPRIVLSGNWACFTVQIVRKYMKECRREWKTVLVYFQMPKGRVERMFWTIKREITGVAVDCGDGWENALIKVVFEYYGRPVRGGPSSFQLLYGVKPRIVEMDGLGTRLTRDVSVMEMKITAIGGQGAENVCRKAADDEGFQKKRPGSCSTWTGTWNCQMISVLIQDLRPG